VKKIVFLDIDGTLASRVAHVPSSAKKACRAARKNGHLLYIASGRSKVQIPKKILSIGFDGVISSGGADIEAGERSIFSTAFDSAMLERLISYFDAHKAPYVLELIDKVVDGPYFYITLKKLAASSMSFGGVVSRSVMRFFRGKTTPFDAGFDHNAVRKVGFFETEGMTYKDVQTEFSDVCEIFRNSIPVPGLSGGEISPKGVHKGAALDKVLEYHGLAREDSIAFGDSDNDRMMIQYAGVGVAMGNADEELKCVADEVTGTAKSGGIAQAFKKHGLSGPKEGRS
jgi:Cof subfamily protein (haloacid dehalogenase superfamily)